MAEPMSDKYYEEEFEFPFWKLIKQRAEEKDISYIDAAVELIPEYSKSIRYRDVKFETEAAGGAMELYDEWAEEGRKKML